MKSRFKYLGCCMLIAFAYAAHSQNIQNNTFDNLESYILESVPIQPDSISDTWIMVVPCTYWNGLNETVNMGQNFIYLESSNIYYYGVIWSDDINQLPKNADDLANNYINANPRPGNCKLIKGGDWQKYGLSFFMGDGTNGTTKLKPNTTYYYAFVGCINTGINPIATIGPIHSVTTKPEPVTSNYAIYSLPYACPDFMPVITNASTPAGTNTYTFTWNKQLPNGTPVMLNSVNTFSYQPPQTDFTSISQTEPTTLTYVRKTTAANGLWGYDVATITYFPNGFSDNTFKQAVVGAGYLTYNLNQPNITIQANCSLNNSGGNITQWQTSSSINGNFTNTSAGVTGSVLKTTASDNNYYRAIISFGKCLVCTTDVICPAKAAAIGEVAIGGQTWMTADLQVNSFNNATNIPVASDWNTWRNAATPYYYNTGNSAYGYIYNKYVITNQENVCPVGWKVPANEDWATLSTNTNISLAKTGAGWTPISGLAVTNTTGFSAVPSGFIDAASSSLTLKNQNSEVVWWAGDAATCWFIEQGFTRLSNSSLGGANGFYIRCIKRQQN